MVKDGKWHQIEKKLTFRRTAVAALSVLLPDHRDIPFGSLTVEVDVVTAVVLVSLPHHVRRQGDLTARPAAIAVQFIFRHTVHDLFNEQARFFQFFL